MSGFSTTECAKVPMNFSYVISLDSCSETAPANIPQVKKEGNKKMYHDHEEGYNPERHYLDTRLGNVAYEHREKLQEHFKLNEVSPSTVEELIQRVKDGQFQIKDKKDRSRFERPYHHIIWRAPGEEPDTAGYEIANAKLEKALTATRDVIMVSDAEKGLEALKGFEAAKFH